MPRVNGMTIQRAKEIAKANNGHLPKMGWETCVFECLAPDPIRNEYQERYTPVYRTQAVYRIYLVNTSGNFSLKELTC